MYLDSVAPEHKLSDHNPANAAGGANHQHGGVLSAGNCEFAHGPTLSQQKRRLIVVRSRSPRNLPQPREFPPHLVENLPRFPAKAHRIDLIEAALDRRNRGNGSRSSSSLHFSPIFRWLRFLLFGNFLPLVLPLLLLAGGRGGGPRHQRPPAAVHRRRVGNLHPPPIAWVLVAENSGCESSSGCSSSTHHSTSLFRRRLFSVPFEIKICDLN